MKTTHYGDIHVPLFRKDAPDDKRKPEKRAGKKGRRAPLIVGLFFYSVTKLYNVIVKARDALRHYWSEIDSKKLRQRLNRITFGKLYVEGEAPKVILVDSEKLESGDGKFVPAAPRVPGHRWNRALTNLAEFDLALKNLIRIYKEGHGVVSMSHIDVHRLSDHIYMRALVREGLITETEYEEWEGFR